MSNNSEENPTIENVLPKWQSTRLSGACEASEDLKAKGVMVEMLGGMSCPWCDSKMNEIDDSYIAVCARNPKHKVLWIPWGG